LASSGFQQHQHFAPGIPSGQTQTALTRKHHAGNLSKDIVARGIYHPVVHGITLKHEKTSRGEQKFMPI
jgi:hypothetical protein